ncbi:MAG TPA: S41 family peptidase [Acetivibrio sp.]|nr:S41 family peptidase [Acetivibrio sp.]
MFGENYDYLEKKDLGSNAVYIDLKDLNGRDEFIEELEKIEDRSEKALVIDIRNSRSGLSQPVYRMLDYMIPKSVEYFFINGDLERVPFYPDNDCSNFKKTIILVSEYTEDTGELFALVLKKHLSNTVIIGRPTRGKYYTLGIYTDYERKFSIFLIDKYWDLTQYGITDGCVIPDIIVEDDSQYMKEVEKLIS